MKDTIERMQELYTEALEDAGQNYRAENQAETETAAEDVGEYDWSDFDEDDVEFSRRGNEKTARMGGKVKYQARRLSEDDLEAYLRAGTRRNQNKFVAIERGEQIILTSEQEITDFIDKAIHKDAGDVTVAYGRVNHRLAEAVSEQSKGKIKIDDYYLELIPSNLQHAYEEHSTAKEDGDIPLSEEDFHSIPEYIDSFTEVLYAIKYSSGSVRVCVSKKLPNGRILIIETVSKSRGALQFKNAIGVSEEKYIDKYLPEYKKRAEPNTRGNDSSKNSLRDEFNSSTSILNEDRIVNSGGSEGNDIKLSARDSEGRKLTREQQEYFKDSKVRDEKGNLMVVYHGTPSGKHTTFRSGTYFTPNREYADKYQNPNASMLSTKKDASAPKTYEVYLNITKPFDTRNPRERRIFIEEYYRKWGTGAPLADSGLPDWTDGMDLQEFIEEMGYDYDGLILDEGATGGYGLEVKSRGLSYVTFSSEQVKNVDNKAPTDNPDIRYSARDYALQVDEVKNKTHDSLNHVYMGTTPTGIAKVLDLPKLPMLITPQHIYSMAVSKAKAQQEGRFKSRYNYHDLGWDTVKKLPEYINKPVLIIKSNTDPDDATFVVVTAQADNAGNPIIAAVKPNGRGNYFNIEFPTNFMLSGYGKDGIQGYVVRAKAESRILYANKNSQKTKNTPSVQFADNILSSDYSANLAQFQDIVKKEFEGTIFENSGLPKFSDRDPAAQRLNQALQNENAAQAEEIKYLRELVRLQGIVSELKIPQKYGMQTMGMLTFNQIGV